MSMTDLVDFETTTAREAVRDSITQDGIVRVCVGWDGEGDAVRDDLLANSTDCVDVSFMYPEAREAMDIWGDDWRVTLVVSQ